MENSIENIWSKGFLKDETLLAPKITNLYNQKSKLLLDQFKRTYSLDNNSSIPLAVIVAVGFGLFNYIILGLYLMLIFLGLFFINRKLLRKLERIKITSTSYHYLLEYQKTIKGIIKFYTKLVGIGFPILILIGYWLFFKDTAIYSDFLKNETYVIVLIVLAGAAGLSLICLLAYRLTSELVYGKYIRKLDDIIRDMKELSNEKETS